MGFFIRILLINTLVLLIKSLTDQSGCTYSDLDPTCRKCVPYTNIITNFKTCQLCSSLIPNCQYCSVSGCDQCDSGYTLIVSGNQNYVSCRSIDSTQCINYGSYLSRFGETLQYCRVSNMPYTSSSTSGIIIGVLLGIFFSLVFVASITIVVILIIRKVKKIDKIQTFTYAAHMNCSLCNLDKETIRRREGNYFDNINILSCGGFLCNSCRVKARDCFQTGRYHQCLTCKRLVTWFVTNAIDLNLNQNQYYQSNVAPQTNERIVSKEERNIQQLQSGNVIELPNILDENYCVVCLKSDPIPNAVIPCANKPKHKLHDNCLADYYKTHFQKENPGKLTCPICRTDVEIC